MAEHGHAKTPRRSPMIGVSRAEDMLSSGPICATASRSAVNIIAPPASKGVTSPLTSWIKYTRNLPGLPPTHHRPGATRCGPVDQRLATRLKSPAHTADILVHPLHRRRYGDALDRSLANGCHMAGHGHHLEPQ